MSHDMKNTLENSRKLLQINNLSSPLNYMCVSLSMSDCLTYSNEYNIDKYKSNVNIKVIPDILISFYIFGWDKMRERINTSQFNITITDTPSIQFLGFSSFTNQQYYIASLIINSPNTNNNTFGTIIIFDQNHIAAPIYLTLQNAQCDNRYYEQSFSITSKNCNNQIYGYIIILIIVFIAMCIMCWCYHIKLNKIKKRTINSQHPFIVYIMSTLLFFYQCGTFFTFQSDLSHLTLLSQWANLNFNIFIHKTCLFNNITSRQKIWISSSMPMILFTILFISFLIMNLKHIKLLLYFTKKAVIPEKPKLNINNNNSNIRHRNKKK